MLPCSVAVTLVSASVCTLRGFSYWHQSSFTHVNLVCCLMFCGTSRDLAVILEAAVSDAHPSQATQL